MSHEYRAKRRAHILVAARRCFVRDGFQGTSMQVLVDAAGVSSGAVYRYFPGKHAVIEAIAAENLEQVVTVIRQSAEDGLPAEAALEFVTTRHAEDGFAAIALLVWSEALRNPATSRATRSTKHSSDRPTPLGDADRVNPAGSFSSPPTAAPPLPHTASSATLHCCA